MVNNESLSKLTIHIAQKSYELPLGRILGVVADSSGISLRHLILPLYRESQRQFLSLSRGFDLAAEESLSIDGLRYVYKLAVENSGFKGDLLSVLNLRSRLFEIFQAVGTPYCRKCKRYADKASLQQFLQAVNADATVMLAINLMRGCDSSSISLSEFMEMLEVRRIIIDGKLYLKDDLGAFQDLLSESLFSLPKFVKQAALVVESITVKDLVTAEALISNSLKPYLNSYDILGFVSAKDRDLGAGVEIYQGSRCPQCRIQIGAVATELERFDFFIGELSYSGIQQITLGALSSWLSKLDNNLHPYIAEIQAALTALTRIGLGDIRIDFDSSYLSSGEAIKLELAMLAQLGICDVILIVDRLLSIFNEADLDQVFYLLTAIVNNNNTVLIHSAEEAVLDRTHNRYEFGAAENHSYVNDESQPKKNKIARSIEQKLLTISGIKDLPFHDFSVSFPAVGITNLRGRSGSGKTRLVRDLLPQALSARYGVKTICLEASSHNLKKGNTLAQASELYPLIVELFVSTYEARLHGLTKEAFSLSQSNFLCKYCGGQGLQLVEEFSITLADRCDYCQGDRFAESLLKIRLWDMNIMQVLKLTVAESLSIFVHEEAIYHKLQRLSSLGLAQLQLIEPILDPQIDSRIKLARSRNLKAGSILLIDDLFSAMNLVERMQVLTFIKAEVSQNGAAIIAGNYHEFKECSDYVISLP